MAIAEVTEKVSASKHVCIRCGECCRDQVCFIGLTLVGPHEAPCDALTYDGLTGKYACGLITETLRFALPKLKLTELQIDLLRNHIRFINNFGEGCDLEHWQVERD